MAQVTQGEIASAFLQALNAPDTPLMRKAVIAWMHAESGNTITANNPWNMTLSASKETGVKTCGSWKSTSSGLVFAVFCTPQDGARASAKLLLNAGHDWRKYDAIVAAARNNSPIDFLNALAHSAWDGGRYGTKNGGTNKLLGIYAGLGGDISGVKVPSTGVSTAGTGAVDATQAVASGVLGGWDNKVQFPVGHVLTAQDVDLIMATLAANGYFQNDPAGVSQSIVRTILMAHIGDPWNKSLQDTLQKQFLNAASDAVPKTPLDGVASIAGVLIQVTQALFDPRKWLLILGLLTGAALTAYGGVNVLSAAR